MGGIHILNILHYNDLAHVRETSFGLNATYLSRDKYTSDESRNISLVQITDTITPERTFSIVYF